MRNADVMDIRSSLNDLKDSFRADYSAARSSRFRRSRPGVSGVGRSSDYHLRSAADYFYMIEYVRDMHRNDGLIRQLTDRCVTLHIQTGFTIDFKTGSRSLDRALYDDFYDWWMMPHRFDSGRTCNGPMLERLVFRQMLVDGDHVVLGTNTGQLQSIEGHRIRSPYTNKDPQLRYGLGVYKNALGDLYRYVISENEDDRYFTKVPKRDTRAVDTWHDDANGIRQVFHVRPILRSSDTRGITAYSPIFDYAGMFEDTNFALLVKQQIAAFLAMSKETQQGATPSRTEIGKEDDSELEKQLSGQSMKTGSVVDPGPGKTYKMLQANIPSTETMAHLNFILMMLGLNLGIPLIAATLDATKTNFTGWRGAMGIAEVGFKANQDDLDGLFHTPMTRWRLWNVLHSDTALGKECRRHAELKGVERVLGRYTWNKPRLKSVQPVDDATADEKNLANGTHSKRQITSQGGRDFREVLGERIGDRYREIVRAHKAAKKLVALGVKDVTWRDMLTTGLPEKLDEKPQPGNPGGERDE